MSDDPENLSISDASQLGAVFNLQNIKDVKIQDCTTENIPRFVDAKDIESLTAQRNVHKG